MTGSEKMGFMDDGRPRDDSSSAVQQHKAELKREENGLEIFWIATFPQDLALIKLMVSEKTSFTDGRTDARATAMALLTQSSRAKKQTMTNSDNTDKFLLFICCNTIQPRLILLDTTPTCSSMTEVMLTIHVHVCYLDSVPTILRPGVCIQNLQDLSRITPT